MSMSACWKCGKELPEGQVECEKGNHTVAHERAGADPSDAEIKEAFRRVQDKCALIDWDKVNSFEDLRAIMAATWSLPLYFPAGIPEAIKPFLKPKRGSSK